MRKYILITFLLQLSAFANICFSLNLPESKEYSYEPDVVISTFDNIELHGNLLTPKNKQGPFPTIIFPNSWTIEEHEYMAQAIRLAKEGFQVFSYSTRGWGCSGGYINVAGENDLKDLKTIIDWLEDETPAQRSNFGMAGISYGGGLSLMGLAREYRIKTAFAMSSWTDLKESLYAQNTPRLFWTKFLVNSGKLLGNLDPRIPELLDEVLEGNEEGFKKWVQNRSLNDNLGMINLLRKPVYFANNFGDNLFQPNALIKTFHKLRGPKVLDLSQGSHATAELPGLFGLQNYVFDKMSSWFKYWLQNDKKAKDFELGKIVVQPSVYKEREIQSYYQVPKRLYLHPRRITRGGLSPYPYLLPSQSDSFMAGLDTGASTGVPFLSAILDAHFEVPTIKYPKLNNLINSIRYQTDRFEDGLKLRGIPRLKLNVEVSSTPYQLIAYIYDVSPTGIAKLITHGAYTGKSPQERINIELVATAYDIEAGHRLAIIIDTQDPLYEEPNNKLYKVNLNFDFKSQSYLEIKGWK